MSATVMIIVSPRITIRIMFHHTSLSSATQPEWPALRGFAPGSRVGRAGTLPLRASSHTLAAATGRRNEYGSCVLWPLAASVAQRTSSRSSTSCSVDS